MPLVKKRHRETKVKTKTFTGCWTCRGRKVKCDATRPKCSRCQKAGLHCGGYSLNLYWITDNDKVPPSAIKRQAMALENKSCQPPLYSDDEVEDVIDDIDQLGLFREPSETFSLGPFSVFQSLSYLPSSQVQDVTMRDERPILENDSALNLGSLSILSMIKVENTPHSANNPQMFGLNGIDEAGEDEIENQNDAVSPSSLSLHLRSSIYRDPLAGLLMNNYVLNIADLLQPIVHHQNPYSSIYVPSAMIGSSNLLFGTGNDLRVPASSTAIFYSLMATSAFHLRGSDESERGGELDLLGREFRVKSFKLLRKAMCDSADSPESNAAQGIMSAMLSLVTADVMEGSMTEYWLHLQGVEGMARSLPDSRLHTVFSFLTTLSQTTSFDLPNIPWTRAEPSSNIPTNDYSLEFTYGITSTLATFMRLISKLSQHVGYYTCAGLPLPVPLQVACADLSMQLDAWEIHSEPLTSMATSSTTTKLLARHHINAFYFALKIYFTTRVALSSTISLAALSSTVAHHLLAIEDLKTSKRYGSRPTASVAWPGFIASCEAGPADRVVWQRWWETMMRYRIGNIARLWKVVQKSWQARDGGDMETPAWMGVLRRNRTRILAV